MCTKFLGDGLCCGWDCGPEPCCSDFGVFSHYDPTCCTQPVAADLDAFKAYLHEAEQALWVATGCEESEADADLADRATDMPRWDDD